jgi:hypothetical protein
LSKFQNSPNHVVHDEDSPELSRKGGVVLLNHCRTHEEGDNLCRNHSRLQIEDLIFNHLKAQYSLATIRPQGWLRKLSTSIGLSWWRQKFWFKSGPLAFRM